MSLIDDPVDPRSGSGEHGGLLFCGLAGGKTCAARKIPWKGRASPARVSLAMLPAEEP